MFNRKWLLFNFIVGSTGILTLYLPFLLMRYSKKIVNLFFLSPYIIIYVGFLNIFYYFIAKNATLIEDTLGLKFDLRKAFVWLCVLGNVLLGIYMIFEFSLYEKGYS
jgi:hypothetical protein